jgi:predicted transcriptional regulator with HTH domain
MTEQLRLTIHIDTYLAEFQQRVATHLSDLRGTLRGIEDGSFLEKENSVVRGPL